MKTLCFLLALSICAPATEGVIGPEKIKCPIMRDRTVDTEEAAKKKLFVDHKGKRYFVCCKTCVNLFKKNPEKYANGAGVPVPTR